MKVEKRHIIILIIEVIILIIMFVFYLNYKKGLSAIENSNPNSNSNQTLDAFKNSSYFKEEYQNAYQDIKYQNNPNFLEITNQLLDKNYSADEINNIFEYLSDSNINKLLNIPYVSLENYYQISNLDVNSIDEYNKYQQANNLSFKDAVTKVNLHLNKEFYTDVKTIEDPSSLTVLVNKYNVLPEDYVPKDLVNVGEYSYQMREVAAKALEELMAFGKTENIELIPFSTYRSYDYQNDLYNEYLDVDDEDIVNTYSAKPGHSEHQTGLAVDIRSSSLNDNVTDSDYEWLLLNSYKYGFIIRYPKGKSEITGYMEEPWHLRYIGVEDATKVHELDITYDEYYDLYIAKH